MEPQTYTVRVIVQPGQLLGLTLCQVTNNVNEIAPGLISELNKAYPGSIEVGDRIAEVNGEDGAAFLLIRAWVLGLNGPGTLTLTVLRPIEFDVAIDVSTGMELGLDVMDVGFVRQVEGDGMVASYNSMQASQGLPYLREGDRIVQVSERSPSTEDGAPGNVLPYLRLAMCGGASPLRLRVRRGEYVPAGVVVNKQNFVEAAPKAMAPAAKPKMMSLPKVCYPYNCLQNVITRADKSVHALRRLAPGKPSSKRATAEKWASKADAKVTEEPGTPSTRGPSSVHSSSLSQSSDMELHEFSDPGLILPGIVKRVHA
jgi:hypothetical protein